MFAHPIDITIIVGYFVLMLGIGIWQGRGKQGSTGQYFFSKGMLPWWAIGMAYVASGMNAEQLVGQNGVGYKHGLVMVNWYYTIVPVVYTALIFVFFPIYLRNNVRTMPEFLGRRFSQANQDVFAFLLLLSYIFLSLPVVFYGGAKVLQVIFPVPVPDLELAGLAVNGSLMFWLVVLALVAGIYTAYGGMSSMIYTAVVQFVLILAAGSVVFFLGYIQLPNGWQDVVANDPGGFHLIQPTDHELIPWQSILLTLFGLHLFYSCMNQALVQRGFGARTEWDVRIAVILVGFFVFLRPFIEIFPGMIARALAANGYENFNMEHQAVDAIFPLIIRELVPTGGLRGLVLVGILSAIMSTIAALLNSISTLITFDVYRKWVRPDATDKQLVRVGLVATAVLMLFSVLYSPVIEHLGGIFIYFQAAASYLAVPIATVFLFGIFWRRSTPAAALTVLLAGIPMGVVVAVLLGAIPLADLCPALKGVLPILPSHIIDAYSLDNFFVEAGITQILVSLLMIGVSLFTVPRPLAEVKSLMWSKDLIRLPKGEPERPFFQSVGFWWVLFIVFYAVVIAYLW
jgi:SSS family solute:Na+ symporter